MFDEKVKDKGFHTLSPSIHTLEEQRQHYGEVRVREATTACGVACGVPTCHLNTHRQDVALAHRMARLWRRSVGMALRGVVIDRGWWTDAHRSV